MIENRAELLKQLNLYFQENDILDSGKLIQFAKTAKINLRSFHHIMAGTRNIGPEIKARLFLATNDKRFAPTTELELKWVINFAPEYNTPETFINSLSLNKDTNPKYALNRYVAALLKQHKVGQPGSISKRALCLCTGISKSALNDILRFNWPVGSVTKIRLYLGFQDPMFAPANPQEKKVYERLKFKIKTPPWLKTETASAVDLSPTRTKQILSQTVACLDRIMAMDQKAKDQEVEILGSLLQEVEQDIIAILLRTRALRKTRTVQAARHILRSEEQFVRDWQEQHSNKGGRQ